STARASRSPRHRWSARTAGASASRARRTRTPARAASAGGAADPPPNGGSCFPRQGMPNGHRTCLRSYGGHMVTWEMPDGTEFRYEGASVSDSALREFVLRLMSVEGMSWDVSNWDDKAIELAFLRRFGERIRVTRERAASGTQVLIFQPIRAA